MTARRPACPSRRRLPARCRRQTAGPTATRRTIVAGHDPRPTAQVVPSTADRFAAAQRRRRTLIPSSPSTSPLLSLSPLISRLGNGDPGRRRCRVLDAVGPRNTEEDALGTDDEQTPTSVVVQLGVVVNVDDTWVYVEQRRRSQMPTSSCIYNRSHIVLIYVSSALRQYFEEEIGSKSA